MKSIFFAAALAAFSVSGCQSTEPSANQTAQQVATPAAVQSGDFAAMISAERAANGLGPVSEDRRLSRAARDHAADMEANGYFSHVSLDGRQFTDRARAAGYTCVVNENIAEGQRTEREVLAAWMASPGHRANIMSNRAREYGLGRSGNHWVLMMGRGC